MMTASSDTSHWLDKYGNREFYQWQDDVVDGKRVFHRPLGFVESCFDSDGRYLEGRADMNVEFEFEVRSNISDAEMRERIVLAWACLRCEHVVLRAKSMAWDGIRATSNVQRDLQFFIDVPESLENAVSNAKDQTVFLADHYSSVDSHDFWAHCQNATRVPDPSQSLSKVFVHPSVINPSNGNLTWRFLIIGGHMIWDGMSSTIFGRNLVHLLNLPVAELQSRIRASIMPEAIKAILPPPQEALYPPISGSPARVRWFWAITRILRHVRKPLAAAFPNPLKRQEIKPPVSLSPVYSSVLDYKKTPPLNTFASFMRASLKDTKRLHRLCREAKVSIGAGCFALAALVMMEMHEYLEPNIPICERKPFISGFPINPRPFFNHNIEPDSLMLAFCDGIALPFLPSSLDLDGRLKLLARQAHRQLASYQKRARPAGEEASLQYMSCRGAGRVLANQYISGIERRDGMLAPHLRTGINPQGAYPARPNQTMQTCGVSSVGRRENIIGKGMYDLNDRSKDFVVDFRNYKACVRARDGEFLIGVGGDEDGLFLNASVDGSTIDPALVDLFERRLETVLNEKTDEQMAKL